MNAEVIRSRTDLRGLHALWNNTKNLTTGRKRWVLFQKQSFQGRVTQRVEECSSSVLKKNSSSWLFLCLSWVWRRQPFLHSPCENFWKSRWRKKCNNFFWLEHPQEQSFLDLFIYHSNDHDWGSSPSQLLYLCIIPTMWSINRMCR